MSDDQAATSHGEPHGHAEPAGHAAHGMAGEGGHGDEHHDAHMEGQLGPIDLGAWGASLVGVAAGLVVAWFFFLAASRA
ncbi:MAG TPA: hypothetical protein VFK38_06800 [Candidatus Limnocylindrales bacterium]|nr:hypothetical protein [Candidatus Limnocylindrales bacterium]